MSEEAAALLAGILSPIIVFGMGAIILVALLSAALRYPLLVLATIAGLVYYVLHLPIQYTDDRHGDWPPPATYPDK